MVPHILTTVLIHLAMLFLTVFAILQFILFCMFTFHFYDTLSVVPLLLKCIYIR